MDITQPPRLEFAVQDAPNRKNVNRPETVNGHERDSFGHAVANKGMDTRLMQDWLGHRGIRHTVWCSGASAKRFDGVWE